ncbi:MAG: hypothetical protein Tsb002_12010 [Wenzhouxiangellaceae bacterium]
MNAGVIGRPGHDPTECVDLLDQMTFADTANGRVATHLADGFYIVGEQQRFGATAGGSQGRLGAGMAAPDHYDLKVVKIAHRPHRLNRG